MTGGEFILRCVVLSGRRTSLRLDRPMWDALDEICRREQLKLNDLCAMVAARLGERDGASTEAGMGLTRALRVFIVHYFRTAATDAGHLAAGHGRGEPLAGAPLPMPGADAAGSGAPD